MGQYIANSVNSQNFSLIYKNQKAGELIYKKWYSFDAEIILADGSIHQLEPKGFWNSTIELKNKFKTLLVFEMGWNGIIIKTFFKNEEGYLLKLNGLLGSKFVLIDTNKNELLVAKTDFKWNKFNYDYTFETSKDFDKLENKTLIILTIIHCINYYLSTISAG